VQRDDAAGWELVPDEHTSVVLLSVIDKVLDGQSTESVATWLNEQGELTPADYIRQRSGKPTKGARWSNATLRQLLKSKSLLGHSTHKGATVRDADGLPVQKSAPLISQDVYERLQAALDSRSFKVTNRSAKASPLLGVLFCGALLHEPDCQRDSSCECPPCGRLMHLRQNHSKARGKTYRYYQCVGGRSSGGGGATPVHEANIVKADIAEELAEQKFLDAYGDEHVKERTFIPAENHQNELDEAVRAAEEITAALGTATSETLRKFYQGQLGGLDSRISQLEKLPTSEARWEWRDLPQTYADAWEGADTEARRQLLLKRLVSLRVYVPEGTKALEARLHAMDLSPKLFEQQAPM